MIRVGMGYDVHKLVEGRDLILGGVNIPGREAFWDIPTRMCFCMPLWMRFWGQQRLAISEDISRTQIRNIRGFQV